VKCLRPQETLVREKLARIRLPPSACGDIDNVDERELTHIGIDLRRSEIDGLVRLGFLSAEMRNDVTAIRNGLYQYFETMLDLNRGAQQA